MPTRQHWPERLWLVRHGQSQGNVARDAAHEAGLAVIDLDLRDVDVPLSDLGLRQAEVAGRWFAALADADKPDVILSSPYVRARQTAEAICKAGGLAGGAKPTILDERLREREFGVFDGLTPLGVRQRFPEEAAHRAKLGKFYHRAPGGESWADVVLRLRSMLNTINIQYAGKRVLVVGHQVVVMCMRYILEEMTEEQILALNKQGEIMNCGIAAFDFEINTQSMGVPALAMWNFGAPMEAEGMTMTAEPNMITGSR
ncbi:MAG: histidine phosphatase family protein [Sphingomonas sp.]|uniref:histidine phosphatase family protein n=1 Tax=Sphingomonas sp. TaxID=28214 RepID=UPI0017AC2F5D|nr:histidine phosphatase family protein [Sphingomonas sp.]MBA3666412.1 histidine phosphatase family protein [Sphingomonas sp.]